MKYVGGVGAIDNLEAFDDFEELLITILEASWRSEETGFPPACLLTVYEDTAASLNPHLPDPGGVDISHLVQLTTSNVGNAAAIW